MELNLKNAVKVNRDGGQSISIPELQTIVASFNIDCAWWVNCGQMRTIGHLHANLCSKRALLVPYNNNCSLALVESILVLDIQRPLTPDTTQHLYEKRRHRRGQKRIRNEKYHERFSDIAVRMHIDEKLRDAAERCLKNKLGFDRSYVIFSQSEPAVLSPQIAPSHRYRGLAQIQHRTLVTCTILEEKYRPQYKVHRKKGKVLSTYEWLPLSILKY